MAQTCAFPLAQLKSVTFFDCPTLDRFHPLQPHNQRLLQWSIATASGLSHSPKCLTGVLAKAPRKFDLRLHYCSKHLFSEAARD